MRYRTGLRGLKPRVRCCAGISDLSPAPSLSCTSRMDAELPRVYAGHLTMTSWARPKEMISKNGASCWDSNQRLPR